MSAVAVPPAPDLSPGPALEDAEVDAHWSGDQRAQLERYAELLTGPGIERGLLGPREAERIWDRHLLNSAGPAELLAPGQTVLDLGSGAGLPGVVLAVLRPDVTVVLAEPLLRRATFLQEVVAEMELRSCVVQRARAEQLAGTVLVDVVTARAVAPLPRLAGWALPLLRPGGQLLAMKGERADAELDQCRQVLPGLGARDAVVMQVGSGATRSRLVVLTRGDAPVAGQRRARGRRSTR